MSRSAPKWTLALYDAAIREIAGARDRAFSGSGFNSDQFREMSGIVEILQHDRALLRRRLDREAERGPPIGETELRALREIARDPDQASCHGNTFFALKRKGLIAYEHVDDASRLVVTDLGRLRLEVPNIFDDSPHDKENET